MSRSKSYDPNCVSCPRLAKHLKSVRKAFPDYHSLPVAPFGAKKPKLFIVGLAPGMHGANATGRPFTGDHAGGLLYKALYKYGFSNQALAEQPDDGLKLINCRITNAVKCLPPENKPIGEEIQRCNHFLANELAVLGKQFVILALGGIAHKAVLKALDLKNKDYHFSHGALHKLGSDKWLLDSYHCSRYNTQTRRLTEPMFFEIFNKVHQLI